MVDAETTQQELDAAGVDFDIAIAQQEIQSDPCVGGGGDDGTLGATKSDGATRTEEAPPGDPIYCADGSSCSLICGVVHNRTGAYLYLSRDSASSWYCDARGPYGYLPNGSNSNTYYPWPDTDCFAGTYGSGWVYYRGLWHPPYDWVRIQTHVWVY